VIHEPFSTAEAPGMAVKAAAILPPVQLSAKVMVLLDALSWSIMDIVVDFMQAL